MKIFFIILFLQLPVAAFSQLNQVENDSLIYYLKNKNIGNVLICGTSFQVNNPFAWSYQDLLPMKITRLSNNISSAFLNDIKEPLLSTINTQCMHEEIGTVDLRLACILYFDDKVICIGFGFGNLMTVNNRVYFINLKILHELYSVIRDKNIKRSIKVYRKFIGKNFEW